jgi:hypothetical protein
MAIKLNRILLAATVAAATLAAGLTPAAAQSAPISKGNEMGKNMGMRQNWDMRRDGNRCRTMNGNCRHFYRGYYYQTPWWTLPLIIGGAAAANNGYYDNGYGYHYRHRGNWHVRACMDRYRSYNPATDMYLGNDGRYHRCMIGY